MSGERLTELTHADLLEKEPENSHWLADNVWHPFANGTGLIQVYDTIANKPLDTYKVPQAQTFSTDWCVQALSSAAGAIVPYVAAGKLAGVGMRAAGEKLGLQGTAARIMASDNIAQIAGAGIYSFAQKPAEGQTRLASAVGTMAGFAAFSGGNAILGKYMPEFTSPTASTLAQAAGRFAVGAAGGLGSYESSNLVASMQGIKHQESWQERFQSMAQGGFVNVALPAIQEKANQVVDELVYSRPGSKGMPVDRELKNRGISDPDLDQILKDNALARVKRSDDPQLDSQAKIKDNTVLIKETDDPAKLAHELQHLRLAKISEPFYKEIGELAKTNPTAAEKAFHALRANMESSARAVENRINARSGSADESIVFQPEKLGSETAANGKTYNEVWQGEWQKFKDDTTFRPAIEYGGKNIVGATKDFEKWMSDHIKVVPEDLAEKHSEMADDPFRFMRGTYYRWAEKFPELNPDLMKAPVVNSVGDLHIDNFGTWNDKDGRLVWGINDFDEAFPLPYTNDLVRLLTSANIFRQQNHLQIGLKQAVDAVLEGYRDGLEHGGEPFILGRGNKKLAEIAKSQMPAPDKFWKKLNKQVSDVPTEKIPDSAMEALKSVLPDPDKDMRIGQRQAGVGSLGRQRFVAITEHEGSYFAAEAKSHLPSANYFVEGKVGGKSYYQDIIKSAVRDPDPFVGVEGDWTVRSLSPTRSKIVLGELSKVKDEEHLLRAMGYETANIHLGTPNAAKNILADLNKRGDNSWLVDAVKKMTKSNSDDQAAWAKSQKKK